VKVITPVADMFTFPFGTVISWATPVRAVPLIDVTVKVSPSRSLSPVNGFRVIDVSSATV